MFKFLKPKKKDVRHIHSAVCGKCIPIEDVKDPVFSSKAMGEGAAVIPEDAKVYAPCDGKLTLVAETGHAFGMTTDLGDEILVHIGLDTVDLKGKGFKVLQQAGTTVRQGTPVIEFDPAYLHNDSIDMTTMVILLNGADCTIENIRKSGDVSARGDAILSFSK